MNIPKSKQFAKNVKKHSQKRILLGYDIKKDVMIVVKNIAIII